MFLESLRDRTWTLQALRGETVGGVLLLAAAIIAVAWANSPWGDSYASLISTQVGPEALHLHMPINVWAADGLLAIFFFVAGLELKHELVHGSLSNPAQAAVPIASALGGMIVPAGIFLLVNVFSHNGAPIGWGIPMATDIAFALAVLAVVGRSLPVELRAFLLTLAVVDDLGAITVIAIFYSSGLSLGYLAGAIACLVVYWFLQYKRVRSTWIYVPLALVTWYLMHASGIHATVAGVALALLTRAHKDPDEVESPVDRLQHRLLPLSAAVCVPIFAFTSAGVDLRSVGIVTALATPVAIGVLIGLVIGKPIGIVGTAWLTARFTRAQLDPAITWRNVWAIGLIAGIGFTVALLISELAFPGDPSLMDSAKVAILVGALLSAGLATVAIHARRRADRGLR